MISPLRFQPSFLSPHPLSSDTVAELFRVAVLLTDEPTSPVTLAQRLSFFHVRVADLYVAAVTNQNAVCILPCVEVDEGNNQYFNFHTLSAFIKGTGGVLISSERLCCVRVPQELCLRPQGVQQGQAE